MESLRGELTALYRKQFMKLDAAECAGKSTTRMRIQLLEAYVKDLNEQNEMLVQMVEEATVTKDDLSFKGKQKQQQLQKVKDCLEQANDELDAERQKCGKLNCEMATLRKENCRLCRQLEETNRQKCLLEERVAELDEIIRKVRQDICDLERQMDCANREASELENCLRLSKAEIDKLNGCICELEKTISRLEEELACSQERESDMIRKNGELFEEVNCLRRTLEGKEEDIRDLHCQIDRLSQDLQCNCEKLNASMETLDELTCKNERLCQQVECYQSREDEWNATKCRLEQEFCDYQACHKYTNNEYEDLEDKMMCYKNKLAECDCYLEEKLAMLRDLESELCCVKNNLADEEDAHKRTQEQVHCLESQVSDLQRDLCCLENEKAQLERELRKADMKIQSQMDEIRCREEQVKECRDSNKDWAETVEGQDRVIQEWKCTLEAKENEVKEWKCAFENSEHKMSELKCEKEKLRSDLAEACSMYHSMVKRTEALDKDLCACKRMNDELQAELKDISCRLEAACTEKSFALQKNSQLEAELQLTCSEINELKTQLKTYERNVFDAQRELHIMDQKCCSEETRLNQEIRKLKCELESELNCRRNLEYQIASKDQLINSLRCTPY
ncbi:polyamine-modulated factor 1-binding protein 1 [Plakobranchus ocellatus]|uniref:Polyamine-modulated factor 1-binding protein 1 n=1 Tax=Plakobranchus ocellatus TaxID=259542 RepID=A0AAV4BV81_9GAST|nr:polyamine-modulated factor 1-binding protein 1 [Plakobranchus ocellatus]